MWRGSATSGRFLWILRCRHRSRRDSAQDVSLEPVGWTDILVRYQLDQSRQHHLKTSSTTRPRDCVCETHPQMMTIQQDEAPLFRPKRNRTLTLCISRQVAHANSGWLLFAPGGVVSCLRPRHMRSQISRGLAHARRDILQRQVTQKTNPGTRGAGSGLLIRGQDREGGKRGVLARPGYPAHSHLRPVNPRARHGMAKPLKRHCGRYDWLRAGQSNRERFQIPMDVFS